MKSVRDISLFQNVPILVRASLNEPIVNDVVADTYRLRRAIPTLKFLAEQGARVIVASHIDPPEGQKPLGTETLRPVADVLRKYIPNVTFSETSVGKGAREAARNLGPGHILVLENLRRNAGEVANDPAFATELAALADVFVEDAFDTCHRGHSSIVGVPKILPSYAGLLLEAEITELTKAMKPASPSIAIIGGAKFSTKQPVLSALLEHYDKVFVGGALANDFLKAQGHPVGKSLVSASLDAIEDLQKIKELLANSKLILPLDSIVSSDSKTKRVASLDDVKDNEAILDHGPATSALLASLAQESKTILWNGPLGNYENGFVDATDALALAIAKSGAYSVIGGGDTVTAIQKLNILEHFSFVSTGGGSMLDFLVQGTLPGIAALD